MDHPRPSVALFSETSTKSSPRNSYCPVLPRHQKHKKMREILPTKPPRLTYVQVSTVEPSRTEHGGQYSCTPQTGRRHLAGSDSLKKNVQISMRELRGRKRWEAYRLPPQSFVSRVERLLGLHSAVALAHALRLHNLLLLLPPPLLLLLLLLHEHGLEEVLHRAGVHCLSRSVRRQRCGEERHRGNHFLLFHFFIS